LARTEKLIGASLVSLTLAAVAALAPATSQATITIGSDLTLPTTSISNNCIPLSTPPCSHVLFAVHAGNAFPRNSPTDGTIVSFGMKTGVLSGANETATFRVARESGFTTEMTGAGTGPTITLHQPGSYSFPASLPIKAGDFVGIDTSSTRASAALPTCGNPPNSGGYFTYHPVLTNGGPFQPLDANSTCELLVQATIQPSSVFGFNPKQVYKVSKKFKIVLPIELPGPGGIKVSGKGLARAPVKRTVSEAGTAKLSLKLAAKKLRRLEVKGKGGLKVTVTFTPVGGDPGTQTFKLKLKAR
jgi:hypothetical protein